MLTRDFLRTADCKTAFGEIEESLLWSAEQRAASLAGRWPGVDFWLWFADVESGAGVR